MNSKIIGVIISAIIISIGLTYYFSLQNQALDEQNLNTTKTIVNSEQEQNEIIDISTPQHLFKVFVNKDDLVQFGKNTFPTTAKLELKPEFGDIYENIKHANDDQKTIVIIPIFTASAYGNQGFYFYYHGECDSKCLTTKILDETLLGYTSNAFSIQALRLLGYDFITDINIDKNPSILQNYDKVILLHNEYVTRAEFDAITHHKKVIYLFPNALYAEIKVDHDNNLITLIRGHNYPEQQIRNGFDWEFDNSELEYDNSCENWHFNQIDNGIILNCYPENRLMWDTELLKFIKDF